MNHSSPVLVEGIDYYVEAGRWVFTSVYHQTRGHCCKNACRHCPFGNSPADREQAVSGSVSRTTRESK